MDEERIVTFLLGAGASAQCLPTVANMNDRMSKMIELFNSPDLKMSEVERFGKTPIILDGTKADFQTSFVKRWNEINENAATHASIDTYAKKLFIRREYKILNELKVFLSAFLTIEQTINKPDIRYDQFWASIIDESQRLPSNLRLLTWNYDYQLELTLKEYNQTFNIAENQRRLKTIAKLSKVRPQPNGFNLIKLNGSCGFRILNSLEEYSYSDIFSKTLTKEYIESLIKNCLYVLSIDRYHTALSFAWEEDHFNGSIVDPAIKATERTNVLVVIGYSFPFFNRKIDRAIINSMVDLESVYIQSPQADEVIERFKSTRRNHKRLDIVPIYGKDHFWLPNEL